MRIYLSKPHMSGAEERYVAEAFASNFVAPLGPQLNRFEQVVADYLGEGVHCVGLSSGSAALHLALSLAEVQSGDDVWVSSMTFAGGVFPIVYLGATPVFIDLATKSWTIDCDVLEDALETANKTNTLPKAIVPTDLYGQSVDIDRLETMCARYGVKLVVDSAESLGASYLNGRKCGTGGDLSILSFNGNKIITTSGGGMLVTRTKAHAERAQFLSTQARDPAPHYEHSVIGYNYRMSNISAAIGLGQMEVLDQRVATRRAHYEAYKSRFAGTGLVFMPEPADYHSSHWLTAVMIDPTRVGVSRETIREALLEHDIESRPLWKPMHMQPVFAGTRYLGAGFDERLFDMGLCLPSGSDMTQTELDEVMDRVSTLIAAG